MTKHPDRFPVLNSRHTIPWELIEPHREQARINHGQTLEQLASRGGLDWAELLCVMTNRHWRELDLQEKGR